MYKRSHIRAPVVTYLPLVPFLFLISIFILLPMFALVVKSFTDEKTFVFTMMASPSKIFETAFTLEKYIYIFTTPYNLNIIWTTIYVSAVGTAISMIVGLPSAYYIAKGTQGSGLARSIVTLPSLSSAITICLAILYFFSTVGPVNYVLHDQTHLLPEPISLSMSWYLVVAGYLYFFSTLTIRTLVALFQMVDPSLVEASRSLGAGEFMTFRKVVLPIILSGTVATTMFVFVRMMASFVFALMLGGGAKVTNIISTEVWLTFRMLGMGADVPLASAFSVILILITFAGYYVFATVIRRYYLRKGYLGLVRISI